jgi:hypothetical protein
MVASCTPKSCSPAGPYFAAERGPSAQNTSSTGACAMNPWLKQTSVSAWIVAASRTTTISYACKLPADGDWLAAERIASRYFASTGFD